MRAEELACLAQQVAADRIAFRRAKENLTICRRDIRKLITAAVEEGAAGDWDELEEQYLAAVRRIPRNPTLDELRDLGIEMDNLRQNIINQLNSDDFSSEMTTNDAQNERHIQNSNTNLLNELEPSSEKSRRRSRARISRPNMCRLRLFRLVSSCAPAPRFQTTGLKARSETGENS